MKVSVALCTYNGFRFFEEQIESILNQTVQVDEIIICDDRSFDKTTELLKKYADLYPGRVKYFINQKNLGVVKNFEKAILLTSGDVIFLSDQDDIWCSNKVEVFLEAFSLDLNKTVLFSNGSLIAHSCANESNVWKMLRFSPKLLETFTQYKLFLFILLFDNVVPGASLAFKKEVKNLICPIPDSAQPLHDEWLVQKLAAEDKVGVIDEKLFAYRIHQNQQVGLANTRYYDLISRYQSQFFSANKELSLKELSTFIWNAKSKLVQYHKMGLISALKNHELRGLLNIALRKVTANLPVLSQIMLKGYLYIKFIKHHK